MTAADDVADEPSELSADAREAAGKGEHRYQMVLAAVTAVVCVNEHCWVVIELDDYATVVSN